MITNSLQWRALAVELCLTVLFGIWTYLIGRQYLPLLTFLITCASLAIILRLTNRWIYERSYLVCAILGVVSGFCASLVALAVVVYVSYGEAQFGSRFDASVKVYPIVSLGWLYSAVLFVLRRWFFTHEKGVGS